MDKLHTVLYDYSQICFFACVWISAGDGYKSSTRRLLTIYVAATLTPKPHSFNDWSRTQRPKKNHWYFLLYLAIYSNSCQVSGLVKLHHRHDFFGWIICTNIQISNSNRVMVSERFWCWSCDIFLNYIVRFRYSFCYQLVCLHGVGIRVRQRCIDHFFSDSFAS